MRELLDPFPDPEVFLALEPEEIAAQFLMVLRRNPETQQHFHPSNLWGGLQQRGVLPETYRPHQDEVEQAIAEAFAWMETQGLIVADGSSGLNGWRRLSRKARRLETPADFAQFTTARKLPRELLHPKLSQGVWLAFMRGEYGPAVFQAMKAVEVGVRDAAGYTDTDYGTDMIMRAFNEDNGPLRDPKAQKAERTALRNLFAGAHGSYKNPHSHRDVLLKDAGEAAEMIVLASHLLRILDGRERAA